jgi:hypothetical protein
LHLGTAQKVAPAEPIRFDYLERQLERVQALIDDLDNRDDTPKSHEELF